MKSEKQGLEKLYASDIQSIQGIQDIHKRAIRTQQKVKSKAWRNFMHQIYKGGVGAGASMVSLHFPTKLQLITIIGWSHL